MLKEGFMMSSDAVFKEQIKSSLKKPSMYRVFLINDDYTSMDFVVEVLIKIFHKKVQEATQIMLDVHKKGKGLVALYTYDIAVTKVNQVEMMAQERGYPLKAGMEEE
jgi:ATP-dependent Clp protease adaptor protein ClpS